LICRTLPVDTPSVYNNDITLITNGLPVYGERKSHSIGYDISEFSAKVDNNDTILHGHDISDNAVVTDNGRSDIGSIRNTDSITLGDNVDTVMPSTTSTDKELAINDHDESTINNMSDYITVKSTNLHTINTSKSNDNGTLEHSNGLMTDIVRLYASCGMNCWDQTPTETLFLLWQGAVYLLLNVHYPCVVQS